MRGLIIVIAIIIVGVIAIAIWNSSQNSSAYPSNQNSAAPASSTGSTVEERQMSVPLRAQNNSGESGMAVIRDQNGKTLVEVSMQREPSGASQPMHFHIGTCKAPGAIRYPLNSVVNGRSTTLLNISYGTFLTQLPLIINVHKSAAQSNIYVACGTVNTLTASSTTSTTR